DFSLERHKTSLVSQRPSRDTLESGVTLEYRGPIYLKLYFYPLVVLSTSKGARPPTVHLEDFDKALREWSSKPSETLWDNVIGPPSDVLTRRSGPSGCLACLLASAHPLVSCLSFGCVVIRGPARHSRWCGHFLLWGGVLLGHLGALPPLQQEDHSSALHSLT